MTSSTIYRKQYGATKRLTAVLLALALSACASSPALPPASTASSRVTLISFNDLHGHLVPSGQTVPVREADGTVVSVPAGGVVSLAALVRRLGGERPEQTLVVAAGDLVGASPLSSGLFHDEPTIEALNRLGLAVSSVGNHEFDKGRDELLRLQQGGCFPPPDKAAKTGQAEGSGAGLGIVGRDTCIVDGRFEGAKFRYLAANVIDRKTGQPLFPPYAIREVGGVKIGFIGVTLKETPRMVSPKGVAGLRFDDEAATINRWVPEVRRAGASVIVVLMHQGAATRAVAINDTSCPGFAGPALPIIDALDPAVALVITGHTHREYVCRRPDGRLVTQAGSNGRMATRIDIDVDPSTGALRETSARTFVARSDTPDRDAEGVPPIAAGIDALLQRYTRLTAAREAAVVGQIAAPLVRKTTSAGESPLGDVVADAYRFAAAAAGAQIAFTNPGGLRDDLSRAGPVSYGQLYRVLPFGNRLVTLRLTGEQLRRVLEAQWEAPQPAGGRVLPVSSGFSYAWDASAPAGAPAGQGQRVIRESMRLHGKRISPEATYRVVVNSYLAGGGDLFRIFAGAEVIDEGGSDLAALVAYFRANPLVVPPASERLRRVETKHGR